VYITDNMLSPVKVRIIFEIRTTISFFRDVINRNIEIHPLAELS